ncbi:hypothetical protein C7S18_12145 [Ahniella affigens]|uniref:Phage tail protein n=1 Tax=Ahniella affigens TaxID=2021234 RepID=A0A2P1PSV3_9GAMM|nr:hypothetical protein [Ahniella affigens]AVP97902.1 hypothetical protein C7S18_12145 [Ahniella affigens]
MPLETFQTRAIALKVESVEGTDSNPTFVANALRLVDGQSNIEAEELEIPYDRPTFGANPFVPVGVKGFIEGSTPLIGAVTNGQASPLSLALRVGSMAETLVVGPPALARYTPVAAAIPSATALFQHGSTLKTMKGCRASWSGFVAEMKKYTMAKVRFEGDCLEAVEQAFVNPDYSAFTNPATPITKENAFVTINGITVEGIYFSLDFNTELKVKEHSEARIARITDRRPSGIIRIVRPSFGTINPWNLWKNQTKVPISWVTAITGTPESRVGLFVTNAQLGIPKEVEWEGDIAYEIPYKALPLTGNDEIKIEFGGGT